MFFHTNSSEVGRRWAPVGWSFLVRQNFRAWTKSTNWQSFGKKVSKEVLFPPPPPVVLTMPARRSSWRRPLRVELKPLRGVTLAILAAFLPALTEASKPPSVFSRSAKARSTASKEILSLSLPEMPSKLPMVREPRRRRIAWMLMKSLTTSFGGGLLFEDLETPRWICSTPPATTRGNAMVGVSCIQLKMPRPTSCVTSKALHSLVRPSASTASRNESKAAFEKNAGCIQGKAKTHMLFESQPFLPRWRHIVGAKPRSWGPAPMATLSLQGSVVTSSKKLKRAGPLRKTSSSMKAYHRMSGSCLRDHRIDSSFRQQGPAAP
mmetsp:Transcript_14083/g.45980  ORF Transcript_14083/g.45980 Transcript_14083/m.45980 type:complete len:321 (-) Transcript_14083:546-1508(-)